jgi:hypothetical protein
MRRILSTLLIATIITGSLAGLFGTALPHDSKWLPNVGEPNVCESKILLAHLNREAKQKKNSYHLVLDGVLHSDGCRHRRTSALKLIASA